MNDRIEEIKESLDKLMADVNERAEEVKENFRSFKDVFGKELDYQAENLKVYREKLETAGKKFLDTDAIFGDIREELDHAVRDLRSSVDRIYDMVKERLDQAK